MENIDFLELDVVRKESKKKDGTIIPARTVGKVYKPMLLTSKDASVTTYATENPDATSGTLKMMRANDAAMALDVAIAELQALKAKGGGCTKLVTLDNGKVQITAQPMSAPRVNVDAALAFIAANPNHPKVIAYEASRRNITPAAK